MEKFPCIAAEFEGNKDIQFQCRARCRNTSTSCPSSVWMGLPTSARSMQRTPGSRIPDVLPSNAGGTMDMNGVGQGWGTAPREFGSRKAKTTDLLFDGFAVHFGRLLWTGQGCRTIMTWIPHGAAGFSLLQCHSASCIECIEVVV